MSQRKLSIRDIFQLARGKKTDCCDAGSKTDEELALKDDGGGCCQKPDKKSNGS